MGLNLAFSVRFAIAVLLVDLAVSTTFAARHEDESRFPLGENHKQVQQWGHIRGHIRVDGNVPPPVKLVITSDRNYCGQHDLRDEGLLVGDQQGLANVFVYLYQTRREKQQPAIHPDYQDAENTEVALDNLKCRFVPHAMCLRTSQTLVAKNSDPIGHNANFESRNNAENKQIPANQSLTLNLERPERLPIKVSCGSHGWMSAYILVRDEPYMTVTNASGEFEIRNLPVGDWTFQFWHERVGVLSDLKKQGKAAVQEKGQLTVSIREDKVTDLGELTIDAAILAED